MVELIYIARQFSDKNFLIAGGSVLDFYKGKSLKDINDIDIFFETEKDYQHFKENIENNHVVDYISTNALSYKIQYDDLQINIQLIHLYFDTPQNIIDGFDINKAQIGITQDFKIITGDHFHKKLRPNYDNINLDTPGRLVKYSSKKNLLLELKTVKKFTSYLIENKDKEFKDSYTNEKLKGSELLRNLFVALLSYDISSDFRKETLFYQFINMNIQDKDKIELLKHFVKDNKFLWSYDIAIIALIEDSKSELWVDAVFGTKTNFQKAKEIVGTEIYNRVKQNLPEYFI